MTRAALTPVRSSIPADTAEGTTTADEAAGRQPPDARPHQGSAKILSHAPANMEKVFFTNGGADANENAIRMARLHTSRDKVLSRYRSYHGIP